MTGFTLIEMVVTLTLASLLGGMLFQFFYTGLTDTTRAVTDIQQAVKLESVMEMITCEYRRWLETGPSPGELASVFEAGVRSNTVYSPYIVDDATGIISDVIDPENERSVEILRITLSNETQTLVSLFTN